jgi:hypothetical protein
MEAEESVLHEFLGDVAAADEAEGEAEEAAFLGFEDGGQGGRRRWRRRKRRGGVSEHGEGNR